MIETIKCECGWVVKGNSIKHAEANLKIHKTSRVHKLLIKNNILKEKGISHQNKINKEVC